jgi:hypothetical protein
MSSLHTTAALGPDLPAGWAAAASMAVQATGSPSGTLMFATVADECVPSPVPLHSIYIGYEGQDVHLLLVRSIAKETVESVVLPFGLHCTIGGQDVHIYFLSVPLPKKLYNQPYYIRFALYNRRAGCTSTSSVPLPKKLYNQPYYHSVCIVQ